MANGLPPNVVRRGGREAEHCREVAFVGNAVGLAIEAVSAGDVAVVGNVVAVAVAIHELALVRNRVAVAIVREALCHLVGILDAVQVAVLRARGAERGRQQDRGKNPSPPRRLAESHR
jgi:hypothetical protein